MNRALVLVLASSVLVAGCKSKKPAAPKPQSLRRASAGLLTIGAGVNDRIPERTNDWPLLTTQFSIITPENCMKPDAIQRQPGRFTFTQADSFVDFATRHNLKVVGHCLVWAKDDRTPAWFFRDGDRPAIREVLLERMRRHIDTEVGRYRGRIAMWDVVNEALDDGTNYLRASGWSQVCGEEFIAKAFEAAGVFDAPATPHRFRHTFARILLQRGVPVSDVADLLGDDEKTVRQHYSRWVVERQQRLSRILKEAFGEKPKLMAIKGRSGRTLSRAGAATVLRRGRR